MTKAPKLVRWIIGVAAVSSAVGYAQGPRHTHFPPQQLASQQLVTAPLPSLQPTPALAAAPVSAALTLADLQQIALSHNPTIVQANMAVRSAQGRRLQAGLYPNPRLGYIGEDIGNEGRAGQHGVAVSQEIVTADKLGLARAVVGHEVREARHALEIQRRRVLSGVRAGYHDVQLARKMIELNEQLARIGKEGLDVTERLLAAQEVARAEVLQVRIEADKAALHLEESKNLHRVAWQRLAALLGQPMMESVALGGDVAENLPLHEREAAFSRLMAESPQLAQARAGVERARCELARQCAGRTSNLFVEAAAKYDHATDLTIADIGLGVSLPLFDRNQGRIATARSELIAATEEVRRTELDLHHRFAATFGQYENARRRVDTYARSILPNAQSSLDMIRDGYRKGQFGYLTLLTAQRTYFGVNLEYLAGLRKLLARSTEIEGLLLDGGLQRPR